MIPSTISSTTDGNRSRGTRATSSGAARAMAATASSECTTRAARPRLPRPLRTDHRDRTWPRSSGPARPAYSDGPHAPHRPREATWTCVPSRMSSRCRAQRDRPGLVAGQPREMKDITDGGYLELANEFEVKGGEMVFPHTAPDARVLLRHVGAGHHDDRRRGTPDRPGRPRLHPARTRCTASGRSATMRPSTASASRWASRAPVRSTTRSTDSTGPDTDRPGGVAAGGDDGRA